MEERASKDEGRGLQDECAYRTEGVDLKDGGGRLKGWKEGGGGLTRGGCID